jgi:ubiquinone/menaquinone biosynthesis C-methylase UbiE
MNSVTEVRNSVAARKPTTNFDRLACAYRWMEYFTFGPWLERCRYAYLKELGGCRRALVFGDGDGRFTAKLLAANRAIEIDAVDSSTVMLHALLRRAGRDANRLQSHCIDARDWEQQETDYDLVVTHFFLDCFGTEEVEALAERVLAAVSPAARWVVSEFAIPEGWFGRLVTKPMVWMLYRAFGLLTGLGVRTLSDHRAALRKAGFMLQESRSWLNGLLASEIWRVGPDRLPDRRMLHIC